MLSVWIVLMSEFCYYNYDIYMIYVAMCPNDNLDIFWWFYVCIVCILWDYSDYFFPPGSVTTFGMEMSSSLAELNTRIISLIALSNYLELAGSFLVKLQTKPIKQSLWCKSIVSKVLVCFRIIANVKLVMIMPAR